MNPRYNGLRQQVLKQKQEAAIRLKQYLRNPHKCLNCGSLILPKTGQPLNAVKIKKFCNHTCSCIHTNSLRGFKPKMCKLCNNNPTKSRGAVYCVSCVMEPVILNRKKSDSSHRQIREHARRTLINSKIPKKCHICQYDKHAEACHRKPIEKFSPDTVIRIINDLSNLVWLCPNHHWEYDHLNPTLLQS